MERGERNIHKAARRGLKEIIMKKFIHGDVIIEEIKELPSDLKTYNDNAVQYGEITGHAHRVNGGHIMFRVQDEMMGRPVSTGGFNGTKYLEIKEGEDVTITHEEHAPIKLPPGIYKSYTVREFDHFEGIIREVAD